MSNKNVLITTLSEIPESTIAEVFGTVNIQIDAERTSLSAIAVQKAFSSAVQGEYDKANAVIGVTYTIYDSLSDNM